MNHIYRTLTLSSLLLSFMLCGCKGDRVPAPALDTMSSDIIGTWKVVKAFKGTAPSRLLDNGEFSINQDGTFKTNILNDPKAYPFTLKKNDIKVSDPHKSLYSVVKVTSDTLIMKSKIQNINFKFITAKDK